MNVCLELVMHDSDASCPQEWDALYQSVLKPVLSFLYAHPHVPLCLTVNGEQVSYLAQAHAEALLLLGELTSRQQVEVLGGGYYAPIFPLLFPVDRSGQIEKLTALLRSTVGKRPRGIALFRSIWEPSLLTTFQSCGMDYVQVDASLIPPEHEAYLPIIMSDQGKTLKILPGHGEFRPGTAESGESWTARLRAAVTGKQAESSQAVLVIPFRPRQMEAFLGSDAFKWCALVAGGGQAADGTPGLAVPDIRFTTPQCYLKTARKFQRLYVPAGMGEPDAASAPHAGQGSGFPPTIHSFLNAHPQIRRLTDRMMYLSLLIAQKHGGDKMRKQAAQEKLWQAQGGLQYIAEGGLPSGGQKLQGAYRLLTEAEKLVRESKAVGESVTAFDYDGDGLNEYVCQMGLYHAVISLQGGHITELDILGSGRNYTASPVPESHGFFHEYLAQEPVAGGFSEDIPFARIQFSEDKFDAKRREIHLRGQGEFGSLHLPVTLLKNYTVCANGFIVQYILKNESPFPIKGTFAVEVNVAETDFLPGGQYAGELILDGGRQQLPQDAYRVEEGVSLLKLEDTVHRISFLLEPNEESGLCAQAAGSGVPQRNIRFFWCIDLPVNRAIEKTINCSIMPAKRQPHTAATD